MGKLSHASHIVAQGRTFMHRMFGLLQGVWQAHYRIRLNRSFQPDLQWWFTFVGAWNGVSMMPGKAQVHNWTDASGHFGCGGLNPNTEAWFQLEWPQTYKAGWVKLREESIALKEILPIVIACALWGRGWSNQVVYIHCDNLGVVALVNAGYSWDPQLMHLMRCLFFIRAYLPS